MTVSELIEQLQGFDPDLTVYAEGCDCINPVDGAHVTSYPDAANEVTLTVDLGGR